MRDLFFRRSAQFDLDDHVVIADPRQPRMVTLDPWPELVFQMADGEHTVGQMIDHLGSGYEGGPPPGLGEQIVDIVSEMVKAGFVELADPVSRQDPRKAKAAMLRDGFLKK